MTKPWFQSQERYVTPAKRRSKGGPPALDSTLRVWKLSATSRILLTWIWVCIVSVSSLAVPDDQALHNPLLRRYFRQRSLETLTRVDARGYRRGTVSRQFVEKRTDALIRDFLDQLATRIEMLNQHLEDALVLRHELIQVPEHERKRNQVISQWKRALDQLSGRAGDLHGMLSLILVGFRSKESFSPGPGIGPDAMRSAFRSEHAYLADQIHIAERRIVDLFLSPTHTIDATELSHENLLINLYRVKKLSKTLARRIDRNF